MPLTTVEELQPAVLDDGNAVAVTKALQDRFTAKAVGEIESPESPGPGFVLARIGERGGKYWIKNPRDHVANRQKARAAKAPEKKPPSPARKHLAALVASSLRKSGLDEKTQAAYADSMTKATSRMPPAALERLHADLKEIRFSADLKAQSLAIVKDFGSWWRTWIIKAAQKLSGNAVLDCGGGYQPKSKRVYVNGKYEVTTYGHVTNEREGVYAHELTHAIDYGGGQPLSETGDWRRACKELKWGTLSRYSAKSPLEGFAEFGRAVYASNLPLEKIEKTFPRCSEFFKKEGLWPV